MLDGFHVLTLTHKQVPLVSIGEVTVDNGAEKEALLGLQRRFGWDELYYLSTCNRVMYLFYAQQAVPDNLPDLLLEALHPEWPVERIDSAARAVVVLHGPEAVRHLMEVASSMDSLVVGEREIIRQLRSAYDRCREMGLTGDHIRLLVRYTIETAKAVYTETRIGEKALSVVALAFQAMQAQGVGREARILMIGAGQTNALFAKFLLKYGYQNIVVFNRTLANAEAVAEYVGGRAYPMEALADYRGGFDALVVATGATEPLVTEAVYRRLLVGETDRKVAVDLSVPNNVDPALADHYPLQMIDIEGLRARATENLAHRERERAQAALIIAQRVYAFREVWHERQVERSLSTIPDDVRRYKERALNEVFGKELAQLDEQTLALIHRMMDYMEKKAVAVPMKTAKAISIGRHKKQLSA